MTDPFAMNEGTLDRLIRMAIGLVMISLIFTGPHTAWGYLGLVPLITGAIGWCPLYIPFHFSTCGMPHKVGA